MLIRPSEEPGSRASAGVHYHGYSSSHTILPEQVNHVEEMWCLGIGCLRLHDFELHHRSSEQSNACRAREPKILTVFFVDVWWVKHCFINDAIQNEIFSIVPSVQIGEKTRTLGLTKRRKQEHSVLKTGYCKRTRSSFQHNPISGF